MTTLRQSPSWQSLCQPSKRSPSTTTSPTTIERSRICALSRFFTSYELANIQHQPRSHYARNERFPYESAIFACGDKASSSTQSRHSLPSSQPTVQQSASPTPRMVQRMQWCIMKQLVVISAQLQHWPDDCTTSCKARRHVRLAQSSTSQSIQHAYPTVISQLQYDGEQLGTDYSSAATQSHECRPTASGRVEQWP